MIPISNNCAIKLTTSLYYFSNGITVQGSGLEPDFTIERTYPPTEQMEWYTKNYGHESSSSNYLKPHDFKEEKKEEKSSKPEPVKNWSDRAKENLQTDNQFIEAINLVNLFYLGKSTCKIPMKTRKESLDFMKKNFITNEKIKFTEIK